MGVLGLFTVVSLNGLDQSGKEMFSLLLHETDDYYFDFVYKNLRSSIFLENSTLAEKPLETSQKFLAPTKSPIYHCGIAALFSKMATAHRRVYLSNKTKKLF